MKRNAILFVLALATFATACNSGGTSTSGKDSVPFVPATPDGSVTVTLENREKDTGKVRIKATLGNLNSTEQVFDLDLLQQGADTALYRVVWDKPNSAYIGVIKSNKETRYYHVIPDSPFVRVRWHTSPPKEIWQYVEGPMGLGAFLKNQPLVKAYKKNIKSGVIIEDFIVKLEQLPGDSVKLHYAFGGLIDDETFYIPASIEPWLMVAQDDMVYFGLKMDGEFKESKQLRVRNGRLEVKTLRKIKFK